MGPHWAVLTLYAAVFLVYAETWAFTPDVGYHMLAAQLIAAGKLILGVCNGFQIMTKLGLHRTPINGTIS